jgi:hypothetical protein
MAWQRRNERKYYYRSRRENGQVINDYYGTGPLAWTAAKMDAAERDRQKAQAETQAALKRPFEEGDAPVDRLMAAGKELIGAVLLSEGFYRHDRGPWSRRAWAYVRHQSDDSIETSSQ